MAPANANRRAGDAAARESKRLGRLNAPRDSTAESHFASGPSDARRYAERALERECAELAATPSGRNDRLNRAAFAIGRLVGAGKLLRHEAEEQLIASAMANGYVAKDGMTATRATIKSGLDKGELHPREI